MWHRSSVGELFGTIDDQLAQDETVDRELKRAARRELDGRGGGRVIARLDQIAHEPATYQHQAARSTR